ncbi:MAG: NAD(P)H-dependent oxidoreductase subunit E [Bacteroidetes bacterium]|nr:NAD(P)H-dependent oxidoreductase subunit E [Bacteroidota bacterium]MCL5025520.1 NAD(P)H-dependent oxidoreductase subunit E [Chloroflexota bacterium]
MTTAAIDLAKTDAALAAYDSAEGGLVGLLQDIQAEYSYLPREALERVAQRTGLPISRIYSLATFFKAFSLEPRGRHVISVCLGTACHVRGAGVILEKIERELGVRAGHTTRDGRFTLEVVNCVGDCAVSPVCLVDGEIYAKISVTKVDTLLKRYEEP